MKHFTKIVLIFAAIFLVLGIVFCVAGWTFGYAPGSCLSEFGRTIEAKKEKAQLSVQHEFDSIEALELSVGAAVCEVSAYPGDKVRIEASEKPILSCNKEGKKLKVGYGKEEHSVWSWIKDGPKDGVDVLHLYVPETMKLKELKIEGGASEITVEGLTCEKLELTCGAGKTAFTGAIEEKASVECGAGSVELTLEGRPEDFDYSLECGLGNISVEDGPGVAGIGEYTGKNNGGKKLKLECGLGSIRVDFQNNL